jgi:CheY-like chemotaxis protein
MPIGSAAPLSGTLPQAPLSPHPMARRTRPFALVPQSSGATAPPRIFPLVGLADDPPRGRILVVEDDAEAALELQRLLQDSGYLAIGPAVCTEEAETLLERRRGRPITCAMIDLEMSGASALADHLAGLHVPLIWLAPAGNAALPAAHSQAPVMARPFRANALRDAVEEAIRQASSRRWYATPPPQAVWPRVFPQL